MLKKLFVLLMVIAVVALGALNHIQQFKQTKLALSGPYYDLPAGRSLSGLCQQWQQQQLLSKSQCFQLKVLSLLQPELRAVKAGVYRVQPDLLLNQLALFRSGKVAQFSFMLREGETLKQSLKALTNAPYLQNDLQDPDALQQLVSWPVEWGPPPPNLEALFFPETYFYTAHSKASDVYRRAHRSLMQQLDRVWLQRDSTVPFTTPYQLLILASIIEKETGVLAEKPLIASVFINRLSKRMKLQTDPTVIYGLGDRYQGDITRAHLKDPHLYNTYVHFGLPPGPIALVSATSLQAAANPLVSDKLYFVAKGDGSHQFSASLAEHNRAVQQYIFGKKP
ncbi:MAG: endolytic transglycosylase MltG [Gammaproteobacteria bacterium]|nr:endolytic transglycosylase MltG [Gammaproteobacteria bacterium]